VFLFFTGRGLKAGAGWARALSGLALGGGYGVYLLAIALKLK